jgi:hypothetical protein
MGYMYDDDGENHDGSSTWYQTRTQAFRANAAYSLYGVLKGDHSIRSCTQATYINSFFTTGGADTMISALALTVKNNGNDNNPGVNCYVVEQESNNNNNDKNNNNNNKDHRRAKSNDNNNNNKNYVSTTLGCTDSGDFAVATFTGKTCDGTYFTNTTDDLEDYNDAMASATCNKIWDYSKYSYQPEQSVAYSLLSASSACDTSIYATCPDPFGKKHMYASAVTVVSKSKRRSTNWNGPVRVLSWMFLVLGTALMTTAYFISSRHKIREHGGGIKGTALTMVTDLKDGFRKTVGMGRGDSSKRKKSSRSRDASTMDDDGTIAPPSLGKGAKPPETSEEAQTRRLWGLGGSRASRLKVTKSRSSKSPGEKRKSSKSKSKEKAAAAAAAAGAYEPPDMDKAGKTPASPSRRAYNPPVDKYDKYVVVPGVSKSYSNEEEIVANIDAPTYVPPGLRKADSGKSSGNGEIV